MKPVGPLSQQLSVSNTDGPEQTGVNIGSVFPQRPKPKDKELSVKSCRGAATHLDRGVCLLGGDTYWLGGTTFRYRCAGEH